MPDLATTLSAIGIHITPETRWRRLPDDNLPKHHFVGTTCWCNGFCRTLSMIPLTHNHRRYLITQCPECQREIIWCRWRMDGQWTGPVKIEVFDHTQPPAAKREDNAA